MIKERLPVFIPNPPGLDPLFSSDWLRIPRACAYLGLPESGMYKLLATPNNGIITFALKLRPKQRTGIRYVWRPSLDAYLAKRAIEAGIHPDAIGGQPCT